MIADRQTLILDPATAFATPQHLVESHSLSDRDKLDALRNWQLDLVELQQAADENMPGSATASGTTAEKLQEVRKAIEAIECSLPRRLGTLDDTQ